MSPTTVPPTSELYTLRDMASRHPNLLSESRLKWALRNRRANGLDQVGAVFESRGGELLIRERTFIAWWLNLAGRHTPRSSRRKRRRLNA